jgi:hypothetical protein
LFKIFLIKPWGKFLWKSSKSKNWEKCKKSVKIIFSRLFFDENFPIKFLFLGENSLCWWFFFFHHFFLGSLKWWFFVWFLRDFLRGWNRKLCEIKIFIKNIQSV